MPERRIPCPECCGRGDPGCFTCHQYGHDYNSGTIPDRRKPTANDRAVDRIKAYLDEMDPHPLSVHSRVLLIIDEEAERDE